MRKILATLLLFSFINLNVSAVEFDTSIDETIRKDYILESSETDLPALPNAIPTVSNDIPLKTDVCATGKTYILKNGTKITLSSQNTITNYTRTGTKVSFVSQNNVYTKDGSLITAGTLFKGTVTDSHPPQITGNGGLIELRIDEIYYNGVMSPLTTTISRANSQKVFLSNIKGERKYWKNTANLTKPAQKVYKATREMTGTMAVIPVVNIVSFVPVVAGLAFFAINATVAPIISVFKKGESISLPAGTKFEIKIDGNTEIRG
ncbi:hypothetical protein IJD44_01750 [bacterium]|nr:hypothetical protein [bacterium]